VTTSTPTVTVTTPEVPPATTTAPIIQAASPPEGHPDRARTGGTAPQPGKRRHADRADY
jgi:hypothetical protein